MTIPINASWSIPLGDFRFVLLGEMRRLLAETRQVAERAATPDFVSREPAELVVRRSIDNMIADLSSYGAQIVTVFPALEPKTSGVNDIAQRVRSAVDAVGIIAMAIELADLFKLPPQPAGAHPVLLVPHEGNVAIQIGTAPIVAMQTSDGAVLTEVEQARQAQLYFAALSDLIDAARAAGRGLSAVEQLARAVGYQAIESGHTLPAAFRPIATSGFRRWQTELSLADPGEGHNLVTCLNAPMISGTVIHVEHIDRGKQTDREIIEAYRLPAPLSAARVRLQAGRAAPCTAYVGRPAFENGPTPDTATYMPIARFYEDDLLKAAHMTASACSVMFINGIADCKIAIERMSARQAVRFMSAVSGNVSRDRSRQFLSAAFNINQPILDDKDTSAVRWIGGRLAIADAGIALAAAGGFDKVTWDGASSVPKSDPIIAAFSAAEWLGLIHRAHEQGLETYISAGMDKTHMAACVETGVDGVGIGTSLHYLQRTADGKLIMGELNPEAVLEVLSVRDAAAAGIKGHGAAALAMLDRLAFERLLSPAFEAIRQQLFAFLSAPQPHEPTIKDILENLADQPYWKAMERHKAESFDKHPVIARAERRLLAGELAEMVHLTDRTVIESESWIRSALKRGDISDLREALR